MPPCSLQNGINKPGGYKTEADFGESMFNNALSCTRYYSWHLWYQQYFVPAHGRLRWVHTLSTLRLRSTGYQL